jgi:trigger factor
VIKNKEIKTLENSVVELSVTIEKESIKKEYDELLGKYAKTAQVKGFRKGKVPAAILERKYSDSLKMESGYNLVEKSLEDVLKDVEKKPLPYYTPRLVDEDSFTVDLDKDLVFKVTYETYPEITLGEYKGVEIEIPKVKISKEDEKRELERYQEQNAVVTEKKEGAVEKNDVATINYCEIDENGDPVAETSREDFTFTVGTGYNYYKIDDDVTGMKAGEEKTVEKTFADDFEYRELAGKKVKVKIKVTGIKSKQLPAIDDELAQDISEKYKTLDDLKKDIKEKQNAMIDSKLKALKQQKIIDKIVESSTIEVPSTLVEQELENSWQNFLYQFGGDDAKVLQILKMQNKTKEDLLEEWRPSALKSVKGQLIVGKIMEKEKLEASDEEIEEELKKQAARSGMGEEEFKKYVEDNNMSDYLKHSLIERKTYDMLVESSVIKTGETVKFLDFIQMNN